MLRLLDTQGVGKKNQHSSQPEARQVFKKAQGTSQNRTQCKKNVKAGVEREARQNAIFVA